jgi:hypothetical protein
MSEIAEAVRTSSQLAYRHTARPRCMSIVTAQRGS